MSRYSQELAEIVDPHQAIVNVDLWPLPMADYFVVQSSQKMRGRST